MRRTLPLLLLALAACDDGSPEPTAQAADMLRDMGAADMAPVDAADPDQQVPDAALPDAARPDAAPDQGPPPRCSAPPPAPLQPDGPAPAPASPHRGVDAWEQASWATLRDHLLTEADVQWVATWDHATARLVIHGGPLGGRVQVLVARGEDGLPTDVQGDLAAIFPATDAGVLGDWASLNAAYMPIEGERGGWLPAAHQTWPLPLLRLLSLFDAPDAPDAAYGLWPWAQATIGTHGGLDLLQSRATFILSGAGARQGVVLDAVPTLPDVIPTVLAALAAPTTAGVGPDGTYADGLHLRRQDGWPRWEALDPDPCVRAKHAVVILFDGLMANEINHLALDDDPGGDLPTFRALAQGGVVYRHGAVVGFPSMSAPGHTTAGTGLWPGHHGVVGNSFWGRAERAEVNPFSILADPTTALTNPEALWALYERMIAGEGVETLSDAVHRAFGPYDPETGAGAYTAVFNEVTLGGADWTTLDHFGAGDEKLGAQKASLSEYQLADRLALVQLQSLLRQADKPVPTTVQLSFVATDGAGESTGPHSDTVREVLADLDGHLGRIREAYAARGALDDTLFVLVSDHGMARQQPGATGSARAVLRAGVPVRHVGSGQIWFATAELRAERVDATVTVQAVAHDDGRPLVGATLTCAGCEPAEAITDAEGRATLAAPGEATLTLTAPGYPPATLTVP